MALIQYVAKLAVDKDTGLPLPELQGQGGTIIARGNPSVIPTIYEDDEGNLAIPGSVMSVDGNGFVPSFYVDESDLPISWWNGATEVPLESVEGMAKRMEELGAEVTVARVAAEDAAQAAQDAADLVEAPADDAVATLIGDTETLTGAAIEELRTTNGARPVGKGELVIHVKDFGAVGDGVTDDTAAIQAALDVIRDYPVTDPPLTRPVSVTGQGGTYRITSSLNLTGMQLGRGWVLRDLAIVAECEGEIALDLSGSRFGHLKDVRIWGAQGSQPHTGIALARTTAPHSCTHFVFDSVSVEGYFTSSALHLVSSENNLFKGCMFVNRRTPDVDGEAFAAILDGAGYKSLPSLYQTPDPTRSSFTVNRFDKCLFQKPFGIVGPAVFIQDAASLSMVSCYVTNGGGEAFVWRLTEGFTPYRVFLDVQLETTGMERFMRFTSDSAGAREIRGLSCEFGNVFANQEMFTYDTLTSLTLRSFKCHLYRLQSSLANGLFNPAAGVTLTGADIVVPELADFNIPDTAAEGRIVAMDGFDRPIGRSQAASAPNLRWSTAGDSSWSYSARTMAYSRTSGGSVHAAWRVNFTPTLGTGSGELRLDIPVSSPVSGVLTQAIPIAHFFGFDLPVGYTALFLEIVQGAVTWGRVKAAGPGVPVLDVAPSHLGDGVPAGFTFGGTYLTA